MRFPRAAMLSLAVLAVPNAAAPQDPDVVLRGELGHALDRTVQRSSGGGFWGVALVAREGEVLLAKGYGHGDYGTRPNTPRSLFEIASASKPFTALGVLVAEMQGELRLEDSIAEHLDGVPEDKRTITIHHLLTHTSGLSPRVGLPYASRATRDELVRTVLESELASAPGEEFAYCNVGYALLAAILEVATEEPFERWMRVEVFRPAGLVETGFIRDQTLEAARATVRLSERNPQSTAIDWHWGWGYRGMGGVVTSAFDLLRWDRALRSDLLLDEAARERSYAPALQGYACGWRVGRTERGTRRVSHGGRVEGYACSLVRYLDEDVLVVLLSNGESPLDVVERAVESVLFPSPVTTVALDAGAFALDEHRAVRVQEASWSLEREGETVVVSLGGAGHTLATVRVPTVRARGLVAELEEVLARRGAPQAETPGTEVALYLRAYEGRRQVTIDDVALVVMPRYRGRGADGEPIVDERVTFVVQDGARGFWPVIAKMTGSRAEALLEGLRAALE